MAVPPPRIERVTNLELFFDLVFVFTLTELSDALAADPTWRGLARTALLLAAIWWMYGGYAWLTNAVSTDRVGRQALLLGGMGGFFVIALAIPEAFKDPSPVLGLAYLAVVLVHASLFSRGASLSVAEGMARIAPTNLLAGGCLFLGLWVGGAGSWLGLVAALALEWGTPFLKRVESFEIGPRHFVERHGLIVIIAIGESVVSTGVGLKGQSLDLGLIVSALLGLALSAGLWWTYFGVERDAETERALEDSPPRRRPRLALDAFGLWHAGLLLGVLILAAGLKRAVPDPTDSLPTASAVLLAGGLVLFLLSDLGFRTALGLHSFQRAARLWSIPAAALAALLGAVWAADVELFVLTVAILAVSLAEASVHSATLEGA